MHLRTSLSRILSLTTLVLPVLAQAPSSPSSAPKVVQIVRVSDDTGTLKYFPEQITADPGTFVMFEFYPKNHTVTESLFANPCQPLPATNATSLRPGIRSGFHPVAANLAPGSSRPAFVIQVNDTKPIWIYCAQQGHCAKGMAMVINQAAGQTDKTLEKYKMNAAAVAVAVSASASASGGSSASGSPGVYGMSMTGSMGTAAVTATSPAAATANSSPRVTTTSTFTNGGSGSSATTSTGGPSLASPDNPVQTFKPGNGGERSKRTNLELGLFAIVLGIAGVDFI